jgi:hypothetical protein
VSTPIEAAAPGRNGPNQLKANKEGIVMRQEWKWIWAFGLVASAATAQAQGWNHMIDRLSDRVGKNVEQHLNGASDKAVDGTFNAADQAVNCTAGDPNCAKATGQQGQGAGSAVHAGVGGSAKCLATDVSCLKQAKAHGQTVEIVTEDELDTLQCSSRDANCLKRAKQLGKKVEITD